MYARSSFALLALAALAAASPVGMSNDKLYRMSINDDYVPPQPNPVRAERAAAATPTTSPGGAVPVNSGAIHLIESLEGFEPNFYTINGHKTIGYGHDCVERGCSGINPPITQAQGQQLLYSDIQEYEKCVCALPNASGLNANQYGALVSFTYNSGCGGVQKYFESDMSSKNYNGICSSLPTTNTLGGELSSRRQKEGAFCSEATSDPSGC